MISALDIDLEVDRRLAEALPEILERFLVQLGTVPFNRDGLRPWCAKHNELLRVYTQAAIDAHHQKRRYERDDNRLCVRDWCDPCDSRWQQVEKAIARRNSARAAYHQATCSCFVETLKSLSTTLEQKI